MADLTVIHEREATASKYKQMGLRDCGKHDHNLDYKSNLTGWTIISAERDARKISRRHKIALGKGKRGKG